MDASSIRRDRLAIIPSTAASHQPKNIAVDRLLGEFE